MLIQTGQAWLLVESRQRATGTEQLGATPLAPPMLRLTRGQISAQVPYTSHPLSEQTVPGQSEFQDCPNSTAHSGPMGHLSSLHPPRTPYEDKEEYY